MTFWATYLTFVHALAFLGIAWTVAWLSHVVSTRRDMAALEQSALEEFENVNGDYP